MSLMGSKWTWAFAILSVSAFAFGIVFFVVTQTISGRDWATLGVGALIGGTVAGLIATFIFHADDRAVRRTAMIEAAKIAAAGEVAEKKALAEAERELARKRSDAEIEGIRARSVAESDAIRQRATGEAEAAKITASAEAALVSKRAELWAALPTRTERLEEIHKQIALAEQNRNQARGNADASSIQAREAASYGFGDMARQNEEMANNWKINVREFERSLQDLNAERERLQAMSDEAYRREQAHARGLD